MGYASVGSIAQNERAKRRGKSWSTCGNGSRPRSRNARAGSSTTPSQRPSRGYRTAKRAKSASEHLPLSLSLSHRCPDRPRIALRRTLNKLEEDIELLRQEERTYSETWQTRKLAFDGIVTSLEAMQEAIRCVFQARTSFAFCLPPLTWDKRGWLTHGDLGRLGLHRDEKAEQERRRALDEEDDAGGGGGGGAGGSGPPGGGGPPPAPGSIDTGDANNTPRAGSLDPNAKPFVPGVAGAGDDGEDGDVEMRDEEGAERGEMDRGRDSDEGEQRRDDLGEREEGQMTDEREEGEM